MNNIITFFVHSTNGPDIYAENNLKYNTMFNVLITNDKTNYNNLFYAGYGKFLRATFLGNCFSYELEISVDDQLFTLKADEIADNICHYNLGKILNMEFYDDLYIYQEKIWGNTKEKDNTNLIFYHFKTKFNSEQDYINKCNELNITISIPFNYTRSEIDKKYPVLKQFWTNNSNLYSYSTIKINDYLGNQVLNKNDVVSIFLLNYLVYKLNKN